MPHTTIRTSYDTGPEGRILIASLEDDPAAGEEIVITIPGRAVWQVYSIQIVCVASGAAFSRLTRLVLDDGENVFATLRAENSFTAGQTETMTWAAGMVSVQEAGGFQTMPLLQPLVMLPGWRIRTDTAFLQSGDNYAAPVVYVRELPQRGVEVGQEALRSALRRLIGEEARIG